MNDMINKDFQQAGSRRGSRRATLRTYAWLKLSRTDTDGQMDSQTLCDNKRRQPISAYTADTIARLAKRIILLDKLLQLLLVLLLLLFYLSGQYICRYSRCDQVPQSLFSEPIKQNNFLQTVTESRMSKHWRPQKSSYWDKITYFTNYFVLLSLTTLSAVL